MGQSVGSLHVSSESGCSAALSLRTSRGVTCYSSAVNTQPVWKDRLGECECEQGNVIYGLWGPDEPHVRGGGGGGQWENYQQMKDRSWHPDIWVLVLAFLLSTWWRYGVLQRTDTLWVYFQPLRTLNWIPLPSISTRGVSIRPNVPVHLIPLSWREPEDSLHHTPVLACPMLARTAGNRASSPLELFLICLRLLHKTN